MPATLAAAAHTGETSPHLALLRATETLARTLRESGVHLARDVECSRATLAIIRTLDVSGPLPVSDIAQMLRVDTSVASRQISLLAAEGYVERSSDQADRRVRTIALSELGRARTQEIETALEARTRDVFADWTGPEIDQAIAVLRRLAGTIDASNDDLHHTRHVQPA